MEASWETIKMYINMYKGGSIYFLIFAACLVYIFIFHKEKRKIFVYPSLILAALILHPVMYQYVWVYVLTVTYWRVFWLLPLLPVIAFTVVDLMKRMDAPVVKIAILLLLTMVVFNRGQYMYYENVNFYEAYNPYKIPQQAVDIADALLELDDEPRAVIPVWMYNYVRQYDTDIKQMYGRNAEGYLNWNGMVQDYFDVWYQLQQPQPQLGKVARITREHEFDYIVAAQGQLNEKELEGYGFEKVTEVPGYSIYQDVWAEDRLMTWTLEKHINEQSNEAFVTITDEYGRFLMIDGGTIENEDYVREVFTEKGNRATSWIVTNISPYVAGTYFAISNQLKDVRYEEALWPAVLEQNYLDIFSDGDDESKSWYEAVFDCYQIYPKYGYHIDAVEENSQREVMGLKVQVLSGKGLQVQNQLQALYDSSTTLRLEGEKESILYVSEVTAAKLLELLEVYGEQLQSDYLIWNCSVPGALEIFQQTVQAKEVISLKDTNEFTGEFN